MTFTDYGLIQLGSFIKGDSPTNPQYLAFGTGSSGFIGSQAHLNDEFYRKLISWSFFENRAQGNVTLSTVEAVGSNIQEIGLGQGASSGSDVMARVLSAIGEKNNTFDVDITFTTRFRRG